jgi:hypothetical protein
MQNLKQMLLKNEQIDKTSRFYRLLKADFSYHSSSIEGSTVTEEDNLTLNSLNNDINVERIATQYKGKYQHDEVIENFNCGVLFDYLLDTINQPITERELKI